MLRFDINAMQNKADLSCHQIIIMMRLDRLFRPFQATAFFINTYKPIFLRVFLQYTAQF